MNSMNSSDEEVITRRQPVKIKPRMLPSKSRRAISNPDNASSIQESSSSQEPSSETAKIPIILNCFEDDEEDVFNECLDQNSDASDELASYFGKSKKQKQEAKKTLSEPIERELTPPPELNKVQFMSTMNSLHKTLSQYSEGILAMNSVDLSLLESKTPLEIDLDPELRAISQNIVPQVNQERRTTSYKVEVYVRAIRHPSITITEENRAKYDEFEKPMKFILMANDTFEQLINYFCQKKSVAKNDLVLIYKNIKVFPRGTPISLGITKDAIMDAFTKDTKENEIEFVGSSNPNYLHLKLQSKDESIEKLRARKTSTIQAIINRYRTLRNLPETTIVILEFQGENLDPNMPVGDTELEDGDMITVKID
ncbi:14407_t:CDS:2 [Ambispora leptoticha]|uniref:14407_t:CDS:1 n=1 Tax=Ambispora leptoticha TaxID=144679 RepID=A0A9N8YY02_9GLOM|nr:14407_t:CDS:2 [Ambispora leptoticha]